MRSVGWGDMRVEARGGKYDTMFSYSLKKNNTDLKKTRSTKEITEQVGNIGKNRINPLHNLYSIHNKLGTNLKEGTIC